MKLLSLSVVTFFFLLSRTSAQTTSPLVTDRDPRNNITTVSTDRLDVIDEPSQFLQVEFFAAYTSSVAYPSKDVPPPVLFELSISLFSYTTEPLYRQHSRSRLVGYADGERIPIGLGIYDLGYSQRTMIRGKSVSQPASPGFRARPLPTSTKIALAHELKDIGVELILVEPVSLESLLRLAQAHNVELQLGPTRFKLNEIALNRLQLLAKTLTPPGYNSTTITSEAGAPNTDSPSETNKTPLEQTMKWLKSRLSSLANMKGRPRPTEFDSKAFTKCQFKYSEFGAMFIPTPLGLGRVENNLVTQQKNFGVAFAELDPEAVNVSETPLEMILRYATKDNELKIKEESYEDGSYYRGVDGSLYQGETIHLKKDGKAAELRDAFIHAIKLCQANPTK